MHDPWSHGPRAIQSLWCRGSKPGKLGGVLRVVGNVAEPHVAALSSAARLGTLADVLRWGGDVIDVIVQDEYTHDVVVRGPVAGPVFLVFDST